MGHPQFTLKLISQEMLTPRVIQLTFTRSDKLPLSFIAGQFITFLLPNGKSQLIRRSYSLASSPGDTLKIAVAAVDGGFATKHLFHLKLGDELLCIGPQGRLILNEEDAPAHYLLVATSTGVAPYRSMLPSIAKRLEEDKQLKITLLLGVRYREDLLYEADFVAFAQQYPRFHFRAYLSRAAAPFTEAYHYPGYVHSSFEMLGLNPIIDLVYLCGNPYMIDESKTKLQNIGFSRERIRQEKYFPSKRTILQEKTHDL